MSDIIRALLNVVTLAMTAILITCLIKIDYSQNKHRLSDRYVVKSKKRIDLRASATLMCAVQIVKANDRLTEYVLQSTFKADELKQLIAAEFSILESDLEIKQLEES